MPKNKEMPQIIRNAFVAGMKASMLLERDHPELKWDEGADFLELQLEKFMEHAEDVTYGWFAPR